MQKGIKQPYLAGRVEDVMTRSPVTIDENDSILSLVELFLEHHYHGVPVTGSDGALVGIARDTEVLSMFVAKEPFVGGYKQVKDIMHSPPFTVRSNETIQGAAKKMFADGTRFLVVVGDERRILGIVTRIDLIRGISWKEPE